MDTPPSGEAGSKTPPQADLLWSAQAEQEVESWRNTGIFPIPEVAFCSQIPTKDLSTTDLRLIHHVVSLSHQTLFSDTSKWTLWTQQMPTFFKIASSYSFVLHAILAFSATHLAWLTDNSLTNDIACQHRGVALKGLQESIGQFSAENADAALAASIILSLQAPDWRAWASLMQSTSTVSLLSINAGQDRKVIRATRPWQISSPFAEFTDEHSMFSTLAGSPLPVGRRQSTAHDQAHLATMQSLCVSLERLEPSISEKEGARVGFDDLISFVRNVQVAALPSTPNQQFELLQPLRSSLLWQPVTLLEQGPSDPFEMALMAHIYAVALAVEPLFPALGAACFGSLSLAPIEEIAQSLQDMQMSRPDHAIHDALSLLDAPLDVVTQFRSRTGLVRPTPDFYNPVPMPGGFDGLGTVDFHLKSDGSQHNDPGSFQPMFSQSSGTLHPTPSPVIGELGSLGVRPAPHFSNDALRNHLDGYSLDAFHTARSMDPSPVYHSKDGLDPHHTTSALEYGGHLAPSSLWNT
ncbi:MAG: hypothetical protein M1838_000593 [Thelocarpon superellum]|nr:MAG: hypothetical protein M1838_000593 [Thelocarpon superellum]